MEPEFITYQKFDDVALARELVAHLENYEIAYSIEEEAFRFDPSMVMNNAAKEYAVKIRSEDFEKVSLLLQEDENETIEKIGNDYYLFGFSNAELLDLIAMADDWNPFDVALAGKILNDRNKGLSEEEILTIRKNRIEMLRKPEPSQRTWVIVGYLAALLGGILGIFIGWHLFTYRKTLPNGERIFGYDEKDRSDGKKIFYLSIAVFIVGIILKIITVTQS